MLSLIHIFINDLDELSSHEKGVMIIRSHGISKAEYDRIDVYKRQDFAKNMVTGFVKLNGMTVGAVANCSTVYDAEGKLSLIHI